MSTSTRKTPTTLTRSSLLARPAFRRIAPAAAQQRYASRLRALATTAIDRAAAPLLRELPRLVAAMETQRAAGAAGGRMDASPVDEASGLLGGVSANFGGGFAAQARAEAKRAAENAKVHSRGQLRRQLDEHPDRRVNGVQLADSPRLRPLIEGFVGESVTLITGIGPKLQADVQALVVQGLTGGVPAARLAEQIAEKLDISKRRAGQIAVDQFGKLDAKLTEQRNRDLGVTHFFWRSSNDERVRGNPDGLYPRANPSHWARNGQRFAYDDPPRGKKGEIELPGTAINCRCYQEADLSTIPGVAAPASVEIGADVDAEPGVAAAAQQQIIDDLEAEAARMVAEVEEMMADQQRAQEARDREAALRAAEHEADPVTDAVARALETQLVNASPAAVEMAIARFRRNYPHARGAQRRDAKREDCENPIRGEDGKFAGCAPGAGGGPTKQERQTARVARAAEERATATRQARMMPPDQWGGWLREAENEVEEADYEIESATEDLNDASDDDERKEATARIIAAADARALASARASAFRDMIEDNRYPDDLPDDADGDEEGEEESTRTSRVYPPLPAEVMERHAPALSAVDRERDRGMATSVHERVSIPDKWSGRRVGGDSLPQGVSVEELSHAFAPPEGFTAVVGGVSGSKFSMEIRDAAGNKVGDIVREFRPGGEIHHSLFVLDEGTRGSGMADVINGQALLRYEKMGVKKVTVDAAWVGRYKWATMGFRFDEKGSDVGYDRAKVVEHVEGFLQANVASEETREQVRRLVDEPWNLSRLTDGNEYEVSFQSGPEKDDRSTGRFHLGKALLLQGNMPIWTGVLDVDRNNEGYLHALSKLKVETRK